MFPFCAPDARDPIRDERAKAGELRDVEVLKAFDSRWGATESVAVLEIWPIDNDEDHVAGTRFFINEKGEKK